MNRVVKSPTGRGLEESRALTEDVVDLRPKSFGDWHPGEVALQRIAGSERNLGSRASRVLLPFMAEELRHFFPLLPFIVISFVDEQSRPWGTILPGIPGFMQSPTPDTLRIGRRPPAGDPFAVALREGTPVGLLGIELPTRRRNRVNGFVSACDASGFTVTVQQAYGNCPKYIQQRSYVRMGAPPENVEGATFVDLGNADARSLIRRADTIFVASFAPGPTGSPSMDISHRGGKPSFLRVDDGVITIPDFSGNRFFNTLGNVLLTGRAGIVVPCFETGDVLVLTGDAELGLDEDSYIEANKVGAERLWRTRPRQCCWLRGALPIALELISWSRYTLSTGDWPPPT
jgi:uncharacterized protein